jgi:hypothetical protein
MNMYLSPTILRLPLKVNKDVLRYLLVSPNPLILYPDTSTPATYHSQIQPSTLLVCHLFHHLGRSILYGENTLISSTPSTSIDFDAHIAHLSGHNRLLITKIRLEIDWPEQLWSHFPLIARYLGELKSLKELWIIIIINENKRSEIPILTDKDSNQSLTIINTRAGKCQLPSSAIANITLKSEKRIFRELVEGLKALKVFTLKGYSRDEAFARGLEEIVDGRK